ncbi:MAG: glycosyl transferase [Gammaproteobacteria bacterium]|nr:glycosyl transferase [Gammaproteobacteria bacterium]
MGDFHQNGKITTLHNLSRRSVTDLEKDLIDFSRRRLMGLVLPSLYSELATPALDNIVRELTRVPYLNEIIIGLDRADESEYRHALEFFDRLPQHHSVLWQDGPRLRALDAKLAQHGLAPTNAGKGRNVWYCYGYALATGRADAIALHDCDIKTYTRELLARLIYPVANNNFSFDFSKGYYARVNETSIGGRVTRLLVTPLILALRVVCGPSEYLDFLHSFRYPLAGEFAIRRDVINDLRIPTDWGLEIGVLSEMHRNHSTNRLCQVDIADQYDHKHQKLSSKDSSRGLSKMSIDIAKAMFRKLAIQGETFSIEKVRTIKATYYRVALDFVEVFEADASMNGLTYDRHAEEKAVEMFAANVVTAGAEFLENPMDTPFIPAWNRVISAVPDVLYELRDAVESDMQSYGAES